MRGNQPNKHIFGVLLLIIIAFVWAFWPHSVTRKFNFSWKDGHRKSDGEEPSVRYLYLSFNHANIHAVSPMIYFV